ncbi:unnamed protein product, partial [Mesorhabditis belari]|uniref:Uncharacterized protein n=1 Tax=Mesorhabditis belari TaxID=2138241 RepID=A0AAF3FPV5_9BILA
MSIMTSLAPLLAGIHYWAFFFSRTIQGISGGFFFSAGCALASRWFPANEKSTLAAIYGSGSGVTSPCRPRGRKTIVRTKKVMKSIGRRGI